MRQKLESEIARFNIFRKSVLGDSSLSQNNKETDIRNYAKYVLQGGSMSDKRELLGSLKTSLLYKDKSITLK